MDISALYNRVGPESLARKDARDAYADAASQAGNTKAYQRAAETALVNLQSVNYSGQFSGAPVPGRPVLAPPAPALAAPKKNTEDTFTLLISSIITLLGEIDMDSLKNRLDVLKSAAKAAADGNKALSENYLSSVAELEAAVTSASASEAKTASAKASLEHAEAQLSKAEVALNEAEPETPEHAQALQARDAAQAKVGVAQQQLNAALQDQKASIKAAAVVADKAEVFAKQVQTQGASDKSLLDGMKTQLNAAGTMVLLMAQFAELMGESAENKIDMEQELFRSMQAARQEYMEQKSNEYLEEVRKSEAASKAMGCIGKILGAVLMVVSVAAAAFTGGASLALAGVGVALMAADMIAKEITGVSFMEQAMKPLMDLVGPLIQQLGKGIANLLKKMGVDEKSAEMAGMIMGAIIGAVAMVAVLAVVMAVGKSAAGKLSSAMGKAFGDVATKLVPDLLKQSARSVSKSFTKAMTKARGSMGLKSDSVSMGKYATRMAIAESVVQAGSASAESSMGIKSGIHQRNASDHLSAFRFSMVISETLKAHLSEMIEVFDQAMKAKDQAIKKALSIQESMNNTSLNMARNI